MMVKFLQFHKFSYKSVENQRNYILQLFKKKKKKKGIEWQFC